MGEAVLTVRFVVMGSDADILVSDNEPLSVAMHEALRVTNHTGRPAGDYELRDQAGRLLDPARELSDYPPMDMGTLFVTLAVGAGGERADERARCQDRDGLGLSS